MDGERCVGDDSVVGEPIKKRQSNNLTGGMPGQVNFRIRIQQGVADDPNVLTGEHEMLYLIGRCAAGTILKNPPEERVD